MAYVLVGAGLIALGIHLGNQVREEVEINTGDQDIDSREPVQEAKDTVFISRLSKNPGDYKLEHMDWGPRGTTKYQYRDLERGSKFTLYSPIEQFLGV